MKRRLLWTRFAYWLGIIGDVIAAAAMLFPQIDTSLFTEDIISNPLLGLGTRRGVNLMIGWTALLYWADRKPVERKDILLLTIFPVEALRLAYLIYAIASGFASLRKAVPGLVIEIAFIVIFAIGYWNARLAEEPIRMKRIER
jgi:hypothetical protein